MRIVKYDFNDMYVYVLEHNGEGLINVCRMKEYYNEHIEEYMKAKLSGFIKALPVETATEEENREFYKEQLELENKKNEEEIDKALTFKERLLKASEEHKEVLEYLKDK